MATTKKITMKQFNGTDYDTLYPKTIAGQISGVMPISSGGTNGSTASAGVNNLVSGLSQITPVSNDLFPFRDVSGNIGASVTLANLAIALGNNGVITPSNLAAQASALGFAKIQSGSYVGTGVKGSANKSSWTFSFPPKVVLIQRDLDSNSYNVHSLAIFLTDRIGGVVIGGATNGGMTSDVGCGSSSLTGNTFEWWDTNKGDQMNDSGVTYTIIGIG